MNLSNFVENLSELIFVSGKGVRELAKEIGCGNNTLYRYLCGEKMPSFELTIKLADYFQCTTDYLLGVEHENYAHTFKPCPPFSKRLQEVLKQKNVTVATLQRKTEITESSIYYWLNGTNFPTVDSLIKIAEVLDCTVDYLLGR